MFGVYVVNLDRRAERWAETEAECARAGLSPIRVPGVDGQLLPKEEVERWQAKVDANLGPGVMPPRQAAAKLGLQLAEIAAIDRALGDGCTSALLLEDDVRFAEGLSGLLAARLRYLPDDWRLVTFGSVHQRKPTPVGGGVYRVRRCTFSHAMLMNRPGMEQMREVLARLDAPIDMAWQEFVDDGTFYAFHPPLAVQRDDFSDISGVVKRSFAEGRDLGV